MLSKIEIKITNKNGQTLEAKMEHNDEQAQFQLVDNMVRMFYFSSNAENQNNSEALRLYQMGYEAVKDLEQEEKVEVKAEETKVEEPPPVIAVAEPETHWGKLEKKGKDEKFQLYYICPSCNDKGKHFILKQQIYCNCRQCGKRMRIRNATLTPGKQDQYGNYYIAGEYNQTMASREEEFAEERFEALK